MPDPDTAFLEQAVALALENADRGEPPFGALVVRGGAALATGVNATGGGPDPTAHAEVAAIRAACRALGALDLTGATVYTSCEPCPMCFATAVAVGVSRIVYAASAEDAANGGFALSPPAAALHDASRGSGAVEIEQQAIDGAERPFARYLERNGPATG
jgi:guanine deaminase